MLKELISSLRLPFISLLVTVLFCAFFFLFAKNLCLSITNVPVLVFRKLHQKKIGKESGYF